MAKKVILKSKRGNGWYRVKPKGAQFYKMAEYRGGFWKVDGYTFVVSDSHFEHIDERCVLEEFTSELKE